MDRETETVSAREYARLHGLRPNTVSKWARDGKLSAIRTNGSWRIWPGQKPPYSKNDNKKLAGRPRIKCCSCRRVRYAIHYTESGAARKQCRDCHRYASTYKKFPFRASVISYKIDLAIYREMAIADESIKADRRQRIEKHAERIQNLGLAGNGTEWED